MKFIPLLFILTFTASAQSTSSDLCSQKRKQYGKNFISCGEVDWGVKPISADYQPSSAGPMTAPASEVKVQNPQDPKKFDPIYKNDYPGILNTDWYFNVPVPGAKPGEPEFKGAKLATKFYEAVHGDAKTEAEDPSIAKWLHDDWYNSLQPDTSKGSWEGKCRNWSAWSMDPQLQTLFSTIKNGIICNGVPFSKGELKEIVTALYPEPLKNQKRFDKFYRYADGNSDVLEDANVALSKLGVFGQGDLGPADVLALAQTARQNGKNMMMDRDPGKETWNQPIQKITDVAYNDDQVNEWQSLTSAEFTTSSGKSEQVSFLQNLASVESDLTQNLLKGDGITNDRLCSLRQQVGESCDGLTSSKLTRSAQVEVLNRVKQSAFNQRMIQLKQNISVVKHEMIIEYGTENKFASNEPDKTVVQSYTYTSVHALNSNGTNGAVIRSQWSPRVHTLSQICADPTLAESRNSTILTRGFVLKDKCSQGKAIDPNLANHEYFTGAVPPQNFDTFRARASFSSDQAQQQKAYNKFLDFMAHCERFDAAVDFLKHLDQAVLNNSISEQESSDLAKEYGAVKNLLNMPYLQSLLGNKYQGVQGVASLKSKLKL